jgi:hypothetical protein
MGTGNQGCVKKVAERENLYCDALITWQGMETSSEQAEDKIQMYEKKAGVWMTLRT